MSRVSVIAFIGLLAGCAIPSSIVPPTAPTRMPITPTAGIVGLNTPSIITNDQIKTWDVALDDANVYWSDCGPSPSASNGKVMKIAKAGGSPIALATNQPCPTQIAVDATSVYYLANDQNFTSKLMQISKNGGVPTMIAGRLDIRGIGVDESNVYWTQCDLSKNRGALVKQSKQGGAPITLDTADGCFFNLAIDATNVFWNDERGIMQIAKAGGTARVLAPSHFHPRALVVDETYLHWIADSYIMQMPKSGGAPNVLVVGQNDLQALATDATNVYWTNTQGAVRRMAKSGGTRYTLVEASPGAHALVVDAQSAYWTNLASAVTRTDKNGGVPIADQPTDTMTLAYAQLNITSLVVDATNAYWTTCYFSNSNVGRGNVMGISKNGGGLITLAVDQVCPRRLALDAQSVYWVNEGAPSTQGEYRDGSILRASKTGGAPTTLASKIDGRAKIAVDDTHIYWSNCESGTIARVAKSGGTPDIMASVQCPTSIGVDGTNVYWLESDAVKKIAKRGGAAQTVASGGGSVLALDNASIYWMRTEQVSRSGFRSCADESSVILRVSKDGGAPTQVGQSIGIAVDALALDDTNIYWGNDCTNGILRVAKTGGTPSAALSSQTVNRVAVDATSLFWVLGDTGMILKKAK